MRGGRYIMRKYLMGLIGLAVIVLSSSSYGLAARPAAVRSAAVAPAERESADVEKAESRGGGIVDGVCELICRGQFDAAGERIEGVPAHYDTKLHGLLGIVHEYQAISQKRHAARETAYQKQLAALDKLRATPDSNDGNDVRAVTKVLSIIAKTNEFADEKQKEELLSDAFVRQAIQEARSKASEAESRGEWLDSYIRCYSWLQAIEPESEEYSGYAEQLVEKANIVASFRNSPCETCEQRYDKIKKEMFIRAINALNFNYVSIIDYRQMARKAIRRCELLAEVMGVLSELDGDDAAVAGDAGSGDSAPGGSNAAGVEPSETGDLTKWVWEPTKLGAWSAALAAIWDEVDQTPASFSKDRFVDIFEKVLLVNTTTVELPSTVLIAQFAEAALSALDPYTVMVWPRHVPDFEKSMKNEFTGIGIEITKQKGLLTVASLLPDTPAYNSGLDAGDVIEAVDGVETKDMSLTCAVRKITGPAGTNVRLTIRREGLEETQDVTITRAKITVPTIRGWRRSEVGKWLYTIDEEHRIGYVRITSFSAGTPSDFEKVLTELEAEGLRGLVLDLRFNSGGLLDSAVAVTDKFIEEGLIVKTQPRFLPTYATAKKESTHPNYPLAILINRYSASASEIVAGALQDKAYKRAVLVGERTVGKGSVQGITPYPGEGAQLKYTMAYYHLPSGQRVESQDEMKKQDREDWGVGPDIEIKLRSDELKQVIDTQRDNDVLFQANASERHVSVRRHAREETLAADPQLAAGILIIKSKLIQEEARNDGALRSSALVNSF
jgi:carboxyl-terminal processing protease